MSELKYWVWLAEHMPVKNGAIAAVLAYFGSPEAVYFAREGDYEHIPELTAQQRASLADKSMAAVQRTLAVCAENGWRIMTLADADYPARLRNIFAPPPVLYIRGRLPVMDEEAAVAVVGTRTCTPYGLKMAEHIAYDVTRAGGLIVSGLAAGIDTAAARGALRAGGRVVGVVGSGLDIVYPKFNRALFDDVAAVGAIVSEYAPGSEPLRGHFPERNRILSGLSVGVVVAEAPEKSGALITAARALEQGRDVYAVPGNADAASCVGSNALLKEGAVPVTSGWDVVENYTALFPEKLGRPMTAGVPLDAAGEARLLRSALSAEAGNDPDRAIQLKKEIDKPKTVEYIDILVKSDTLTPEEAAVIAALGDAERHVDDVIEASGLAAAAVLSTLTLLQIRGWVVQTPGKRFRARVKVK